MRRFSRGGQQTVWRIMSRCFRPTVDTFIAVLLFGVAGTIITVLWTVEPRSGDPQADEERMRRELVEEFIRERDKLQEELNRLNGIRRSDGASVDDLHVRTRKATGNNSQDMVARPAVQRHGHRVRFEVGVETDSVKKPPEILRTTERTRHSVRTARVSTDPPTVTARPANNVRSPSADDGDEFLRKVRLKLRGDVKAKPEVGRLADGRHLGRRSNATDNAVRKAPDVSRRWCSIYNVTPEVGENFDCMQLLIKPTTIVCLYPDVDDVHVSQHLRQDGLWEPHMVRLFQNLLFQNPDLGVIDVGAHIGQYSLLAASMGRRVVAVEPHLPSLRRLHKGIKIGNLENQMTVVQNAVSDVRGSYQLDVPDANNQGGAHVRRGSGSSGKPCDPDRTSCPGNTSTILMDDLVEVVDFQRAVMKVDIEGHEHRAFVRADRLFDSIRVDYIFMEWINVRAYYGAEVDDTEDKRLVQQLVNWLTRRGYTAHSMILLQNLNPEFWYGWPDDVFWQHRDADQFL